MGEAARARLVLLILWSACLISYALTTARDVLPADSGEFQIAAAGWGILHPPGYPLYTLVGALWVRLVPVGTVFFRLNLLSAVLAATTLVLVAETVRVWAASWGGARRPGTWGGLGAALLLGAAPTFWAQATTVNIRMPALLFAAWGFLALARYQAASSESERERALLSLAPAVGLGVGHHPSLVFVATGWALALLLFDVSLVWQPRRWWKAAGVAALAWLLPQLYIPLRGGMADVPLAGAGLNTWQGFWFHVLARGFSGDMFAFANPQDLALRLPLLGTLFRLQFPLWTLAAAVAGWLRLCRRHWRLGCALLLSWGMHALVTITYRAPQTVEYLMPAYLPVVLAFGLGLAALARWLVSRRAGRQARLAFQGVALLLAALLLFRFPAQWADFSTLAHDTSVRERVAPLLEQAPAGALVLADWRWATPLWALQQMEGLGDAVEVAYVYPEGDTDYESLWRERAEAAGERPLFTTHVYDWEGWTFAPVGGSYRLFRRPLLTLPESLGFTPLAAEIGPLRLLGYRVVGAARPGGAVEVQIAWQATGPQEPAPSLTARLTRADGAFLTHSDRYLGTDTADGEVRFTTLTLRVPLEAAAGPTQLAVGVYTVEEGAFNNLGEAALAELAIAGDYPVLPTAHITPGVVLGAGPFLRGVDVHVAGEAATVYVHLCGPGQAVVIESGDARVSVERLWPGQCRSVSLVATTGERPTLRWSRPDGRSARLLSWPWPVPQPGDRYVPLGDALVLVGAGAAERDGRYVVDLRWCSARAFVEDYAVSVRLHDAEGGELGRHDGQPALGAIPTLKWVTRGMRVRDPHVFAAPEETPVEISVEVYERFRGTVLSTGGPVRLSLDVSSE